ncbi:hypothetical protein GGI21_005893, partial [Coemansia aciculifera]
GLALGDVLSAENVAAVLLDADVRRGLGETLPKEIPSESPRDLDRVVRSPQFRQALAALSLALDEGQLAGVVAQLGLEPRAGSSVAAFLEAVAEQMEMEMEE